ncbi:MAG: O-antigen ligase family protein [Chloroflexaceae bacterium]|nr:O-antigen ligase family protein [Chloroflexaceae bacterium]
MLMLRFSPFAWWLVLVLALVVGLCAGALALLPLRYAAMLVGLGIGGALVVRDPVWALYAVVLSVPIQEIIHLPGGLSGTQAALMLMALVWVLRLLAHPERPITFGYLTPILLVLVWVLVLSTTLTPYSQEQGVKETLRWGAAVLAYLVTRNTLARGAGESSSGFGGLSAWRVAGLVGCLLLAPVASALVGLGQFVLADGPPSFEIAGGRFVRAYGTIGHPNSFAGYLNMGWPLALALVVGAGWSLVGRRALPLPTRTTMTTGHSAGCSGGRSFLLLTGAGAGAGLAILLAALLASFSRGGWLGAVGGLATMIAGWVMTLSRQSRRAVWRWAMPGVIGAVVVLVVAGRMGVVPVALAERLDSMVRHVRLFDVRTVQVTPENFSVVERMAHLQAGWAMFLHHPLTGVGPGNYTHAYEGTGQFQADPYTLHPWYLSQGHAHNFYLNLAAEAGVGGWWPTWHFWVLWDGRPGLP